MAAPAVRTPWTRDLAGAGRRRRVRLAAAIGHAAVWLTAAVGLAAAIGTRVRHGSVAVVVPIVPRVVIAAGHQATSEDERSQK